MWQIGVWETGDLLAPHLAALGSWGGVLVRAGHCPSTLTGVPLDGLVAAPDAAASRPLPPLVCSAALLPGCLALEGGWLSAPTLVSYGTSSRDTLTLSSLGRDQAAVAVQRSFYSLAGGLVEAQELILPHRGLPPHLLLAQVGVALLLELPLF